MPPLALDEPTASDDITHFLLEKMPWLIFDDLFATHHFGTGPSAEQGWKLHVSATPWSALTILEHALPVILEFGVACKIVYTSSLLLMLNNGAFGRTQVGKFITIYPSSDEESVRIAIALDKATDGLPGPRVPSDRPLRPGSIVHYRYGAFSRPREPYKGRQASEPPDALGSLTDYAGRRMPDRRELFYLAPVGLPDPFEMREAYVAPAPRQGPLADRYLVASVLAVTTYGGVYRAIDLDCSPPRMCVLKEYWRYSGGDLNGRMAPDWGRHEARLLLRWDSDPYIPRCFHHFELDGNFFAAIEYIEGETLAAEILRRRASGETFSIAEVIDIGKSIGALIAHMHEVGIIYRDLNPSNIVLTASGDCRLIDFGIAYDKNLGILPAGLGTIEFSSPQQWEGGEPCEYDDVFSWAATMYALATEGLVTSDTRSLVVHPRQILRTSLRILRPEMPRQISDVIDRVLAGHGKGLDVSMSRSLTMLRDVPVDTGPSRSSGIPRSVSTKQSNVFSKPLSTPTALSLASEVADELVRSGIERDGGMCWASQDVHGRTAFCGPDLYHGAAGVALFLAEVGQLCDNEEWKKAARSAARWLAGPVWATGRAEPGLYCGESGVGWLFIRLAEILQEPGYLNAAELRARRLQGVHFEALDLIHGAAGLVVFLVRLAGATAKSVYLDQARGLADVLIGSAKPAPHGKPGMYWPMPAHRARDPIGRSSLGLSHGAAGVGLALVELAAATEDRYVLAAAKGVAEMLLAEAQPYPQGGWRWRETLESGAMRVQGQCHGAIGIGQFFLRLGAIEPDERYFIAAREAALTSMLEMPNRVSPGLCHGVAGDGSYQLDCFNELGDPCFREQAEKCGKELRSFRSAERSGGYVMRGSTLVRPDLLVGSAGVGWFYLRLAQPDLGRDPAV